MKKALKWVGIVLGVVVLFIGGFYGWAVAESGSLIERQMEAHSIDFPIPFPLTEAEVEEIRQERLAALEAEAAEAAAAEDATEGEEAAEDATEGEEAEGEEAEGEEAEGAEEVAEPAPVADPLEGVDLDAIALERAIARGQHLVEARYACIECHGDNFGGGEMINDPAFAIVLGPNLTSGEGGRTADYTTADWDRSVRHGILPDGRPSVMPAEDYQLMADQELSDIIAYLRSVDPVDNDPPRPELGPIGTVLMATGKLPFAVDLIERHDADHPHTPPNAEPTPEFGRHLAGVCTGCHREGMNGGPILAGPPDWIPSANLTPHDDGIGDWQYEDFVTAMRELRRPDGSEIQYPMSLMQPYAQEMTDVELQAIWAHLQTLEATATATE